MKAALRFLGGAIGLAALLLVVLAAVPPAPRLELDPGAGVPPDAGLARWSPVVALEDAGRPERYLAGYTTGEWSGRLVKTRDNPLERPLWDAAILLDSRLPEERSLWTLNAITSAPVPFSSATFAQFDPPLQAAFNALPASGKSDGAGTVRVEYLRGDRTLELNGLMRVRQGMLGGIVHSGPVYQRHAETPVVYAGASDGFLHAFHASDGRELWGYLPRFLAENTPGLTDPKYRYRALVDGVPVVATAQVRETWRTVLASGAGGGGAGIFALDVTWPGTFGTGENAKEATPLFEFTAADDPAVGEIQAPPLVARIRATEPGGQVRWRWFVITGSGYNNGRPGGEQAVFFLALDKPRGVAWKEGGNYFKVKLGSQEPGESNGIGPLALAQDDSGNASFLYAGDLQGRIWRIDLTRGLPKATEVEASPLFIASMGGKPQPITSAAAITPGPGRGHMVVFGTGRYLARGDEDIAQSQRIYSVWDRTPSARSAPVEPARLARAPTSAMIPPFKLGDGKNDYLGCYIDLAGAGERVVRGAVPGIASVALTSFQPKDDLARLHVIDPLTCASATSESRKAMGAPPAPVLPDPALTGDANYSPPDATGRRQFGVTDPATMPIAGAQDSPQVRGPLRFFEAGRVSWRELRSLREKP